MQHDSRNLNTWIEISESAYAANLKFFRKLIGNEVELSVVVKSNAYSHGWQQVAGLQQSTAPIPSLFIPWTKRCSFAKPVLARIF
jgi:alanine racemase